MRALAHTCLKKLSKQHICFITVNNIIIETKSTSKPKKKKHPQPELAAERNENLPPSVRVSFTRPVWFHVPTSYSQRLKQIR